MKEIMKKTETGNETGLKAKLKNAKNYLMRKKYVASLMLFSLLTSPMMVFADGEEKKSGEDKWDAMISFITPWISRLGGVVILIGAIEFGLAWKSDDAEGKTKGMRTAIAGCIVYAVGQSTKTFLY